MQLGGKQLQPNVRNPLFQHEYGHYLQSQASGWFYIPRFGIPSAYNALINEGTDLSDEVEQDAQARSLLYLTKIVNGFDYDDWDYENNTFYHSKYSVASRKEINEAFFKKKLMYPSYIIRF